MLHRGISFPSTNKVLLLGIFALILLDQSSSAPAPTSVNNSNSFISNLLNHTIQNHCLYPLKTATTEDAEVTKFYKSIDESCQKPDKTLETALCIVIANQVSAICNKTKNKSIEELSPLGISLRDMPAVKENKNVSFFCGPESLADVPNESDVPEGVKTIYVTLIDPVDRTPCINACQSVKQEPEDPKFPKIKPLCILLKATALVRKFVDEKFEKSVSAGEGTNTNVQKSPSDSDTDSKPKAEKDKAKGDMASEAEMQGDDPSISAPAGAVAQDKDKANKKEDDDKSKDKNSLSSSSIPNSPVDSGSVSGKPKPSQSQSFVSVDGAGVGVGAGVLSSSSSPGADKGKFSSTTSTSTPSSASPGLDGEDLPPPLAGGDSDKSKLSSSSPQSPASASAPVGVGADLQKKPDEKENDKLNPQIEETLSKPKKPAGADSEAKDKSKDKDPDEADYNDIPVPLQPDVLDSDANGIGMGSDADDFTLDKNKPEVNNLKKQTGQSSGIDRSSLEEDGGYFNYFIFFVTFLALSFIVFHNKRRLIAYVVEGKNPRQSRSRRRSSSTSGGTSYRRLENNFD